MQNLLNKTKTVFTLIESPSTFGIKGADNNLTKTLSEENRILSISWYSKQKYGLIYTAVLANVTDQKIYEAELYSHFSRLLTYSVNSDEVNTRKLYDFNLCLKAQRILSRKKNHNTYNNQQG